MLVCDGTASGPHAGLPPGINVAFSGPHREADDLIEARISASSAPGRLTVVSSDRRVMTAARKRGCPVLSSKVFLERLALDAQRPRRRPTDRSPSVDLPPDLIAEAQALLDDKKKRPKH